MPTHQLIFGAGRPFGAESCTIPTLEFLTRAKAAGMAAAEIDIDTMAEPACRDAVAASGLIPVVRLPRAPRGPAVDNAPDATPARGGKARKTGPFSAGPDVECLRWARSVGATMAVADGDALEEPAIWNWSTMARNAGLTLVAAEYIDPEEEDGLEPSLDAMFEVTRDIDVSEDPMPSGIRLGAGEPIEGGDLMMIAVALADWRRFNRAGTSLLALIDPDGPSTTANMESIRTVWKQGVPDVA